MDSGESSDSDNGDSSGADSGKSSDSDNGDSSGADSGESSDSDNGDSSGINADDSSYSLSSKYTHTRGETVQYKSESSSPTTGPTKAEINAAEQAIHIAETARDNYKAETVSSIRTQILQLEASIAEKEVNVSNINKKDNLEPARIQMESAAATLDTYKNQKLLEYRQVQTDLQDRISDLTYTLSGVISKEEQLKRMQETYRNSLAQKRYEALSQINSSLQSLESELVSAQSNLRLYQIAASLYEQNLNQDNLSTSISLSTYEHLSGLLDRLDSINSQLLDLDNQIEQMQEQIEQGTVKAEQNGTINTLITIVSGDIISSGTQLATIIPQNESAFRVQIYVNSADIAGIEIGDKIKYNISALPSNQYGTITGKVLRISNDALIQDGKYSGYFLVEGSIDSMELVDKDGNVGAVTIGMETTAKIVTQEKSIFRYLLEKINLF